MTEGIHARAPFEVAWEMARRAQARLTEPQARLLFSLAASHPQQAVEVGSLYGGSAVLLGAAVDRLVCIDPFARDSHVRPGVLQACLGNILRCPWQHRISVVTLADDQVVAAFPDESISFLFLDHEHTESATARSIRHWKSKLRRDALLAVHDYGHPRYPGVKSAVDASELAVVDRIDGIVVCMYPQSAPTTNPSAPVNQCHYRHDPRMTAEGETASCRLLQQFTGVTDLGLCTVRRDACEACCHSSRTAEGHDSVIASLAYQLSDAIVRRGGVAGCDARQALLIRDWSQQRLDVYLPGADRPPLLLRDRETCFYFGASVGQEIVETPSGHVRHQVFECLHPEHRSTTVEHCRTCRDWTIAPAPAPPLRQLFSPLVTLRCGPPIRRWAVGVTTAPRRQPVLEQCIDSLARAGWTTPRLFVDSPVGTSERFGHLPVTLRAEKAGAWPSYYLALLQLYFEDASADAILLVQDDAIFYDRENLREYLEETLWPGELPGPVSLFCSTADTQDSAGWHQCQGAWTRGAQAFVFPRSVAATFLADSEVIAHRLNPQRGLAGIDFVIGQWALRQGVPVYFPTPSLVQHVGQTSTLWPTARAIGDRRAHAFAADPSSERNHSVDSLMPR